MEFKILHGDWVCILEIIDKNNAIVKLPNGDIRLYTNLQNDLYTLRTPESIETDIQIYSGLVGMGEILDTLVKSQQRILSSIKSHERQDKINLILKDDSECI